MAPRRTNLHAGAMDHAAGPSVPFQSTLAAQIAHSRTNAVARQELEGGEEFSALLKDFIRDPIVDEKSPEDNAQLICCVAEMGLDLSNRGNPFNPPTNVMEQASQSLSVIELIVQKTPDVLFYSSQACGQEDAKPPLVLFLLPKLINIVSTRHWIALPTRVEDFLVNCTQAMFSKAGMWQDGITTLNLLRDLVQDILLRLESFEHNSNSRLAITVPSAHILSSLWPYLEQPIAFPQGYQTTLNDAEDAMRAALALVSTIFSISKTAKSYNVPVGPVNRFAINCCQRILASPVYTDQKFDLDRSSVRAWIFKLCCSNFAMQRNETEGTAFGHTLATTLADLQPTDPLGDQNVFLKSIGCLVPPSAECNEFWRFPAKELMPSIIELTLDVARFPTLISSLQYHIYLLLYVSQRVMEAHGHPIPPQLDEIFFMQPEMDSDTELNGLEYWVERLELSKGIEMGPNRRPSKRQKLDGPNSPKFLDYDKVLSFLSEILTDHSCTTAPKLSDAIFECFRKLTESEKARLIERLGIILCARSNGLKQLTLNFPQHELECLRCDLEDQSGSLIAERIVGKQEQKADEEYQILLKILGFILDDPSVRRSASLRLLLARSFGRLANHRVAWHDDYDLSADTMTRWCLRSLHSSLRELRVVSAQSLVPFVRHSVPAAIRTRNRRKLLEFLKALTDRNDIAVQETLVMAWSLVGRICGDRELNIALLELVKYLGHSHNLVSGVAYNELLHLCLDLGKPPIELFKPFWRDIAPTVVKNFTQRPQMAQQLSDLLGFGVNDLLRLTQSESVPYLILTRNHGVLQRIADAQLPPIRVPDLLFHRQILPAVISQILQQPQAGEGSAITILREAIPDFQGNTQEKDFLSLFGIDPHLSACEILKTAGEQEESRLSMAAIAGDIPDIDPHKTPAIQALKLLSNFTELSSLRDKALSEFLRTHVLGIMAHFTDIIDHLKDRVPLLEKKRALWAMERLVRLADMDAITIAMPQIRATLQSALQNSHLLTDAFKVWVALINVSDEVKIEPLLDQTFSIIVQNWSSFDNSSRQHAHDTIASLLKTHRGLIRERIAMLPSLSSVKELSAFGAELDRLKAKLDPMSVLEAYSQRCKEDNATVVRQALQELVLFLQAHENLIHMAAMSQQPNKLVGEISRSLLDASLRFRENHADIVDLCAQCLGVIGCIDPNRIEVPRVKKEILMLDNFDRRGEVIEFVATMLETVLVEASRSAPTGKAQSYFAYVMQELLKFCGFTDALVARSRSPTDPAFARWQKMPESIASTLTPYFNSKYVVVNPTNPQKFVPFPTTGPVPKHSAWLRTIVFYLLHRAKGQNAGMIFPVISRVIWSHDLGIPSFMLPFCVLNVIIGGTDEEVEIVRTEFVRILQFDIDFISASDAQYVKQCSENVFQTLDYLGRWLQEKRRVLQEHTSGRGSSSVEEIDDVTYVSHISCMEKFLWSIPAEVISRRAVQCGSYARALFHFEQHLREMAELAKLRKEAFGMEEHYKQLQSIYAHIDEPDGIEGLSAHLHVLDPSQQVLEHKRAGRWPAALTWYEIAVEQTPEDLDLRQELFACLRASGRYDSLLSHVENLTDDQPGILNLALPFAAEASWMTGKWQALEQLLGSQASNSDDFNVGIGKALLSVRRNDSVEFSAAISSLREMVTRGFSPSTTASLSNARNHLIRLHTLYEIEILSGFRGSYDKAAIGRTLEGRLDILGSLTEEKQYLLGIRRATMELTARVDFNPQDIAKLWLASSRLARKANLVNVAYDAILRATHLKDDEAKLEHSRLLFKDGHHRKAIQSLQGAITANLFQASNLKDENESGTLGTLDDREREQHYLAAKTQLLLAKWMDKGGQTQQSELLQHYRLAIKAYRNWDKGHYALGSYYHRMFDFDKTQAKNSQSETFRSGDLHRVTVENYLRSMVFGPKYLYRTVPKVLTLWLDLGQEVQACKEDKLRAAQEGRNLDLKSQKLDSINHSVKKYAVDTLPPYIFYTAFAQILSRINHPHKKVWEVLQKLTSRITVSYPRQALWSVMAIAKSKSTEKATRATVILALIKRNNSDGKLNTRDIVSHGMRLQEALLQLCDRPVEDRKPKVSLSSYLGFNHKLAPCDLVVPLEKTLTAVLPSMEGSEPVRNNHPFSDNPITISSFSDEVLVLYSLQKPRKLTVRGSDGENYGLLCKPRDDLRKDHRLLEFNAMIDRGLRQDVESSKRRLYIKTYAVTPLNEENGAIEWVDGLKPLRDIILFLIKSKGISVNYQKVKVLLEDACAKGTDEAAKVFMEQILPEFPAVLYLWFIEKFPEPDSWFNARLRYTRSAAVMSIVGHALGLGDRHGENILLEQGSGGVFHVDFNCLFEKGLTFEKPELVPFRLTHNMTDAMGPYGYEGPFRQACEITLRILRQYEDTLMTIMETFLHDPTTDFISKPKRRVAGVPETPEEVLDSVKRKLGGVLKGENLPLSVDGYVDALIRMAVDPENLAAMYIGWCAFL